MTNFEVAKVFAEIDLHKPLPEIVCARFESRETVCVEVSFPHLPSICKLCLEAWHTSKRCPQTPPPCGLCKKVFHEESICLMSKANKRADLEKRVWVTSPVSEASSSVGAAIKDPLTLPIGKVQPVVESSAPDKKVEVVVPSVTKQNVPALVNSVKSIIPTSEQPSNAKSVPPTSTMGSEVEEGEFVLVTSKKKKNKNGESKLQQALTNMEGTSLLRH